MPSVNSFREIDLSCSNASTSPNGREPSGAGCRHRGTPNKPRSFTANRRTFVAEVRILQRWIDAARRNGCAVQSRLCVVAINLSGHDDDQLIFETLNDRGAPLLKADLIKNWIFQQREKIRAETDTWPDQFWNDFDDDWWREETSQGRHMRSRIDTFLQYWLTMRTRDEVLADDVFRTFTEYAADRMSAPAAAEGFLAALLRDAEKFRSMADNPADTEVGRFYQRVVQEFEMAATMPLLMWIISDNHNVPDAQVQQALSALKSWVIRRTLLRRTMKDVNKTMGVDPRDARRELHRHCRQHRCRIPRRPEVRSPTLADRRGDGR